MLLLSQHSAVVLTGSTGSFIAPRPSLQAYSVSHHSRIRFFVLILKTKCFSSFTFYKIIQEGDGDEHPLASTSCSCHYEGRTAQSFPEGKTFDSRYIRCAQTNQRLLKTATMMTCNLLYILRTSLKSFFWLHFGKTCRRLLSALTS